MTQVTRSVSLPSHAAMDGVSELWQAIMEAADGPVTLNVQADSVERMTTPYVQLLIATGRSLGASGGALRLQQPSSAVEEAFTTLGLSENFKEMAGHE